MKLAELGVSPAVLGARLREKRALGETAKAFGGLVGDGAMALTKGTLWLKAFSPAVAAGIIGYMMAQSKRVSPADLKAKKDIMLAREIEEQRRLLGERRMGVV